MDNVYICTPKEKEDIMFAGLKIYTDFCLGEYFTPNQIDKIADILRRLRSRPVDVEFSDEFCSVISEETVLRNIQVPRRMLRKDECAIFFYNVGPYAMITRNQTARLAKLLLPNFFATEMAINSSFTRHTNLSTKDLARISGLSITNLPSHTAAYVERKFLDLGYNDKHRNNGRK